MTNVTLTGITHDSENLTTKLLVGMSAALATSLSVIAIPSAKEHTLGENPIKIFMI